MNNLIYKISVCNCKRKLCTKDNKTKGKDKNIELETVNHYL